METLIKEVKHRKPKKLPVFVSAEDLLAILKVSKHKHHKFAYMMGWYSGLRISEILNLEPRDIDFYMDLARRQPPTIRDLENVIRCCGIVMAINVQNLEINNPELFVKDKLNEKESKNG